MRRQSNNHPDPLLIDQAAAAELPSAEAVGEWAREKRVFVSSVMSELREERYSVAAGIRAVGLHVVIFEEFGGRDADWRKRTSPWPDYFYTCVRRRKLLFHKHI